MLLSGPMLQIRISKRDNEFCSQAVTVSYMLRLFRKRKSCTSSDRSVSACAAELPGAGRGIASSSTSAMLSRVSESSDVDKLTLK